MVAFWMMGHCCWAMKRRSRWSHGISWLTRLMTGCYFSRSGCLRPRAGLWLDCVGFVPLTIFTAKSQVTYTEDFQALASRRKAWTAIPWLWRKQVSNFILINILFTLNHFKIHWLLSAWFSLTRGCSSSCFGGAQPPEKKSVSRNTSWLKWRSSILHLWTFPVSRGKQLRAAEKKVRRAKPVNKMDRSWTCDAYCMLMNTK